MTKRREFIKKRSGYSRNSYWRYGFSAKSYDSVIGANDRINLAVIGIRNQGSFHIENWCNLKESHNVGLKTLCDTDEKLFDHVQKW